MDSASRMLSCWEECTEVGPWRAVVVLPLATRMESRMPPLRRRFPPWWGISKSGTEGTGSGAWIISGTAWEECARKERAVNQT
jgi:hypothetical protein